VAQLEVTTPRNTGTKWDLAAVCAQIEAGTPAHLVENRRVLAVTPDTTRSAPMPLLVRAVQQVIGSRAARLDYMVALGTHPVMSEQGILDLYGVSAGDKERDFAGSRFMNHRWDRSDTLVRIGRFEEREIAELTGGLFAEAIDVTINRAIFEYDLILIVGPVFPHEIVGFSGGHKYLFPGISGGEFLDFFHWLSAVITCRKTIGRRDTPARAVVERAAEMVDVPRHLIAMVVTSGGGLEGLYVGAPEAAWPEAVAHSARVHVVRKPRPFHTVFGHAPEMYDEMWVGGKVMYKLEPVVADGGTLIVYGPHIREISRTWGRYLEEVGYHVADYFRGRMQRFRHVPRGVLAHSALVKGEGSYRDGVERPRVNVTLATGLSAEVCERINLGYLDPATVDPRDYRNREEEGILYVDHAGETLHLVGD
jgi:nickel-dependent lactate racemase